MKKPFIIGTPSELAAMGFHLGPDRFTEERLARFEKHLASVKGDQPDRRAICDNYILELIADLREARQRLAEARAALRQARMMLHSGTCSECAREAARIEAFLDGRALGEDSA